MRFIEFWIVSWLIILEFCVIALDFVDVWGRWFVKEQLADLIVTCLEGIVE